MAAAVQVSERVFAKTAPTAEAYLMQARFYSEGEDYPHAIEAFHKATEILGHDEIARALVTADDVGYFLAAASAIAGRDPGRRAELASPLFESIPYTRSSLPPPALA